MGVLICGLGVRGKKADALPSPTRIVCEGDSLTAGTGSFLTSYPEQLATLRGSISVIKIGRAGAGLNNMIADYSTQLGAQFVAGAYAVIWGGTNDRYAGASVATIEGRWQTEAGLARSTGYKVALVTMLPRSDAGTPAGFEADRLTLNTWLRANYATFADVLIDVAADGRIGDSGDELDPVYYNYHDGSPTDKVHLNGDTPGGSPNGNGGYWVVAHLVDAGLPA